MRIHHTIPCLFVAGITRDHDIAPVYPHTHILPRYKECVAVMAVLTTELPVDPDPLAHRNPASKINITVTSFRVGGKNQTGLLKQGCNTLTGDLFCYRVAGSFLHCVIALPRLC